MTLKAIVACIFSVMCLSGIAQLSPGELARVHEHLEGLANCTQCHVLGKGISEDKCLTCHDNLRSRIDEGRGYHSSVVVRESSCISCHSDHHGRDFQIIRFDEDSFDHLLTGYSLEGAHARIDCRSCHQDQYIADPEIKQRENSFLGLEKQCISCHVDPHQGTLSSECLDCHDFNTFTPASGFEHTQTNFVLKGKHAEIDCRSCHAFATRNGKSFQMFAGIAFENCTNCHEDIHRDQFGKQCASCHTEESWYRFNGMSNFNHDLTRFTLRGSHSRTDCFDCHRNGTGPRGQPFQEFVSWSTFDCHQCHEDVHNSRFGANCTDCHSTLSFTRLTGDNKFVHDLTSYPLEGLHETVSCDQCHTGSKTQSLKFDQCISCHLDYHQGEFSNEGVLQDCAACHTTSGFTTTTFDLEQHNSGRFPLDGGHLATPCSACHRQDDSWTFRNIGTQCVDCHEDVHTGFLDEKWYPQKDCRNCHDPITWASINFDHTPTGFALEGAHIGARCSACHNTTDNTTGYRFTDIASTCSVCHQDTHLGQFTVEGKTECNRCHGFDDWSPIHFNHGETAFALEGAHLSTPCTDCHTAWIQRGSTEVIVYQIDDFSCAACH